jgi:hypothetical protein
LGLLGWLDFLLRVEGVGWDELGVTEENIDFATHTRSGRTSEGAQSGDLVVRVQA